MTGEELEEEQQEKGAMAADEDEMSQRIADEDLEENVEDDGAGVTTRSRSKEPVKKPRGRPPGALSGRKPKRPRKEAEPSSGNVSDGGTSDGSNTFQEASDLLEVQAVCAKVWRRMNQTNRAGVTKEEGKVLTKFKHMKEVKDLQEGMEQMLVRQRNDIRREREEHDAKQDEDDQERTAPTARARAIVVASPARATGFTREVEPPITFRDLESPSVELVQQQAAMLNSLNSRVKGMEEQQKDQAVFQKGVVEAREQRDKYPVFAGLFDVDDTDTKWLFEEKPAILRAMEAFLLLSPAQQGAARPDMIRRVSHFMEVVQKRQVLASLFQAAELGMQPNYLVQTSKREIRNTMANMSPIPTTLEELMVELNKFDHRQTRLPPVSSFPPYKEWWKEIAGMLRKSATASKDPEIFVLKRESHVEPSGGGNGSSSGGGGSSSQFSERTQGSTSNTNSNNRAKSKGGNNSTTSTNNYARRETESPFRKAVGKTGEEVAKEISEDVIKRGGCGYCEQIPGDPEKCTNTDLFGWNNNPKNGLSRTTARRERDKRARHA
mmetsp:Transcript_34654/g.56071  ORF Transcript_34654/g.56071 Transcript_34654/m.56071 type:complete len:550 (-) Transcript_34654:518-2167(-)